MSHRNHRLLVPAYLFSGVPLSWGCTDCGKLFSRTIEEVLAYPLLESPRMIRAEFEHHRCALHLLSPTMG